MSRPAPSNLDKLARVLGLLGSPIAGERDAAALAADRLVRASGLEWADVLDCPKLRARSPPAPSTRTSDLVICLGSPGQLNDWERKFLNSIRDGRALSQKQKNTLAQMAAKVRAS